jgi:predicted phosphodiesterase
LGDLVSDYRVTPAIIRLAEAAGVLGILGNHEKTILFHTGSPLRARLAPADLAYLEALPATRTLDVDGRRLLVVHGSPWDDPTDYRCTYVHGHDRDALERLGDTAADVVLLGHTHIAMLARTRSVLALNPGSCGEARDQARHLSYAQLDLAAGAATIFEIRPGLAPQVLAYADI